MNVGQVRVDAVLDGTARLPATLAYAGSTEDQWAPHASLLDDDGNLELTIGGFLLRGGPLGHRVVLVDAGLGPIVRGPFSGGALVDSLGALGVAPADVTDVLFTHLHFDHVGWATQQGSVIFDRATYRCHERDWEHFVSGPSVDEGAVRKLSPLADRLEPWSGDGQLFGGVDLLAAPGHTPGSTMVVISDGADRAMLLGDVIHCPVELEDDEWQGMYDVDPALAKRTRNALAREIEGTDVPVAAAHFPGMRFGRLLLTSGRRQWGYAPQ